MGVIYKFKPELVDFILQKKKEDPSLSCRQLSALTQERFGERLSKSSINKLLQASGLSLSVGRRRKAKWGAARVPFLGTFFLKAMDSLGGGLASLADSLSAGNPLERSEVLARLEYLLYERLFDLSTPAKRFDAGLWSIINRRFSQDEAKAILSWFAKQRLSEEAIRQVQRGFLPVRAFSFETESGEHLLVDAQLHTAWAHPSIPLDFSVPLSHARKLAQRIVSGREPLVLFMAPGYDAPPKLFVSILLESEESSNKVSCVKLLGEKYEEIDRVDFSVSRPLQAIFGLWPWQYVESRVVEGAGIKQSIKRAMGNSVLIEEVSVGLCLPGGRRINLRGGLLRGAQNKQEKLFVASNFQSGRFSLDNILQHYGIYNKNFDEKIKSYSKKIEFFVQNGDINNEVKSKLERTQIQYNDFIPGYLNLLSSHFQAEFLSPSFQGFSLDEMINAFYCLPAQTKLEKETMVITFAPPDGYAHLPALADCCSLLNERNVSPDGATRFSFRLKSLSKN